jgi:hypothetical protein
VGVVVGALVRVGEDGVRVLELLEGRGGGGDVGAGGLLVGVEGEGEAAEGELDVGQGAVPREAQDLVVAPLRRPRHRGRHGRRRARVWVDVSREGGGREIFIDRLLNSEYWAYPELNQFADPVILTDCIFRHK